MLQANAFSIDFSFIRDFSLPYERFTFKPETLQDLPPLTKQHGFYYFSPHWIYSKRSLAAPGEPLRRDSLTWLSEDEEADFDAQCWLRWPLSLQANRAICAWPSSSSGCRRR